MQHIPQPHEIYRHFKGKNYEIITLAEHTETGEMLVIYQAMYGDYKTYARTLSKFLEKVDREKYPEASQVYRFEPAAPGSAPVQPAPSEINESGEAFKLDPLVTQYLDADTYAKRLNILEGLHHRVTDDMINVMAIAADIEVKPGSVEDRYLELRGCLLKLEKFECSRLR